MSETHTREKQTAQIIAEKVFHGVNATQLRRFSGLLDAIAERERARIFGSEPNGNTSFHRWVLRLSIECLREITLSGAIGMSRNSLQGRLKRHERSIRRAINLLKRNDYIVANSYEAGKYGGRASEVFRATLLGVNWLNSESYKNLIDCK